MPTPSATIRYIHGIVFCYIDLPSAIYYIVYTSLYNSFGRLNKFHQIVADRVQLCAHRDHIWRPFTCADIIYQNRGVRIASAVVPLFHSYDLYTYMLSRDARNKSRINHMTSLLINMKQIQITRHDRGVELILKLCT